MKYKIILLIVFISFSCICFSQNNFFAEIKKPNWDYGPCILEDHNGDYLLGSCSRSQYNRSYDFLLLTIDSLTGNVIDEIYIGDLDTIEWIASMQITSDSGLIVGGSKRFNGFYTPFIMKLNQNKVLEWSLTLPNLNFQLDGYSAIQLRDNSYCMLASRFTSIPKTYIYNISENGIFNFIDSVYLNARQIIDNPDSSIIFIGSTPVDSYNTRITAAKYSYSLDSIWQFHYGDSLGRDKGRSIITSENNGFLLACVNDHDIPDHSVNIRLIEVDSSGHVLSATDFPSGNPNYISKNSKGFYALSATNEYGIASYKFNLGTGYICSKQFSGSTNGHCSNTTITSNDDVIMSVNIKSRVNGKSDVFVAKIDSNCNLITDIKNLELRLPSPKIYPNPFNTFINLKNNSAYNSFEIYNATGNLVFRESILPDENKRVNLSLYPVGIYYVVFRKEESFHVQKIIKIKKD